jgi:hypothetical protein
MSNRHVQLTISLSTKGVRRTGFGTPLNVSYNAAWSGSRVRSYSSLAAVAVDFPSTSSPEYRFANAVFSQNPHPQKVKIARGSLPPTQRYKIDVAEVRNTFAYQIQVEGDGVTSTLVSFTSDGTATNDEIVNGLLAALNLVVGKNFTATTTGSVGSLDLLVTADAAAEWFSLEVKDVTALSILQNHADPGIATDLAAIQLEDSDWYALDTSYNSNAMVVAAAAWAEANEKLYNFDCNETETIQVVIGSGTDTIRAIHSAGYMRTAGWYHPSPWQKMTAAIYGRLLWLEPGSDNWKFKELVGIDPVTLTDTQEDNLIARFGNSYAYAYGRKITFEGTTGSEEFIDNVRSMDWVRSDMASGIFGAMVSNEKLTYEDDGGVQIIENEMRASLKRAVKRTIARKGTDSVEVPLVADVAASTRAQRILPDLSAFFELAGAVNIAQVGITVTA